MKLKKLIALLLAGCFLLLSPIAMLSCSDGGDADDTQDTTDGQTTDGGGEGDDAPALTLETLRENPYGAILSAMQLAGTGFFADDAGLFQTVNETVEQGSVTLSFAHETLLGDIKRINETIYIDSEAKKYVSKTQALMNQRLLSAYLFFDREGLTFKGNAVLGSDKALEIDLTEFLSSFGDSAAAELTGMSAEMLDTVVGVGGLITEFYEMLFAEDPEKASAWIATLGEILSETVKETETALSVSYEIDNDALAELSELIAEDLSEAGDVDVLAERLSALFDAYDVILRTELLIDPATGAMTTVLLQGELASEGEGTTNLYLMWRELEDRMELTASVSLGTHSASANLILNKQVEGAVTSYTLSLDGALDGNERRLLESKYVYDVGGGVRITGTLYDEDGEPIDLILLGQITVDDTEASIRFTSLKYKNLTVKFDASITFTPNTPLPQKPEDSMNVVEMTEEDWRVLAEELKESVFGSIFFGDGEAE